MADASTNVSTDLLWEICNGQNSLLIKRKMSGGVQLSRDPLNLTNKHSRKYDGFVNEKGIGIQAGPDGKGITLLTKKASSSQKPAAAVTAVTFRAGGSRKIYRSIIASTAKAGYRPDLRREAVARASAILLSQKGKKESPVRKLRGAKARKAKAVE